jgi:MoxR-like ATPase
MTLAKKRERIWQDPIQIQSLSTEPIEVRWGAFDYVKTYLEASPTGMTEPMVVILVGHTGAAKSAIVKKVISTTTTKYGLRGIDVRVSFMDRFDVEGFVEIWKEDQSDPQYSMSPFKDFICACDEFLALIREFIKRPEVLAVLTSDDPVYPRIRELCKTPVLCFEEINRCPQSIRQMLTVLLNKKEFLVYPMKEARLIATANLPVSKNAQDAEELARAGFYQADGFDDQAFKQRFVFVDVDPMLKSNDVQVSWWHWALGAPYARQVVYIKPDRSGKYGTGIEEFNRMADDNASEYEDCLAVITGPYEYFDYADCTDKSITYGVQIVGKSDEPLRASLQDQRVIDEYVEKPNPIPIRRSDILAYDLETGRTSALPEFINVHPDILHYLSDNAKDLYNMDNVISKLNTDITPSQLKSVPITTFRTWEFMTRLLRYKDRVGDKKVYSDTLNGMMDKGTAERIGKFLKTKKSYDFLTSTDPMTEVMEESLSANVPVLLQGPTSIGKTARVEEFVEKIRKGACGPGVSGCESFTIDLSTKDRTGVRGYPTPVEVVRSLFAPEDFEESPLPNLLDQFYRGHLYRVGDYVSYLHRDHKYKGNVYKIVEMTDDTVTLQEYSEPCDDGQRVPVSHEVFTVERGRILRRWKLPQKTTETAQYRELVEKLIRAKRKNIPIVLFIDEINRVTSPVNMTVVMEAISDNRIMGIDFGDTDVKVVAACNLGSMYKDAKPIDPAVVARFLNIVQDSYDQRDFQAAMKWMKERVDENELHPVAYETCMELGPTDEERFNVFRDIFFMREEDYEDDRVFSSTRALTFFAKFINSDSLEIPIKGRRVAGDKTEFLKRLRELNSAEEFLKGWIGSLYKKTIPRRAEDPVIDPSSNTEVTPEDLDITTFDMARMLREYFEDREALVDSLKKSRKSASEIKEAVKKAFSSEEEGMYEFFRAVEDFLINTRTQLLKQHLRSDSPNFNKFITAFNKVANEKIQWKDLSNSRLAYLYLQETFSDETLEFDKQFAEDYLKAIEQWKTTYTDIDHARWMEAFIRFFDAREERQRFTKLVERLWADPQAREVLSRVKDRMAHGLVRAAWTAPDRLQAGMV